MVWPQSLLLHEWVLFLLGDLPITRDGLGCYLYLPLYLKFWSPRLLLLSIGFSLDCPLLWLMGWSVHMSNSLQISLGRRFPRFLFHIAFLLRQSLSSLFWMSMVFFAFCEFFNPFLQVMSLGFPPKKSSRSTSTLLFDPALGNSSSLSPRTSMLWFGHVWINGLLDTFLKFVFSEGLRIVSIHVGSFKMYWHLGLHLQKDPVPP